MFWGLFTKKRQKIKSEDEEYTKSLELDYTKRLAEIKREEKLRTLREKYEFEREKQQIELERMRIDLAERKAELFDFETDDTEPQNNDMNNFLQMFNMARSSGLIQSMNTNSDGNTPQKSSEPEDFSQTNDFIKKINSMEPEKYQKLVGMIERFG